MRLIDPHVHVWKQDPAYPWAPETTRPPAADATVEMLLALMDANGVERTVLVQPIQYRWDNRYVADCLHRFPERFMAVCRVNPQDPAAPDHLSTWVEEAGFRGVRLSPAEGPEGDWFTGPLMDPLLSRAAALGVPLLVLTRPGRLGDLATLLERHPDLDVCVDHMADANPTKPAQVQAVLNLARYPRVYIKISHSWSISREEYPWRDTWPLVQAVYDAYGAQRIMFATDWPVSLARTDYADTIRVVRDEMDFWAPGDLDWVMGGTALRLWPFA